MDSGLNWALFFVWLTIFVTGAVTITQYFGVTAMIVGACGMVWAARSSVIREWWRRISFQKPWVLAPAQLEKELDKHPLQPDWALVELCNLLLGPNETEDLVWETKEKLEDYLSLGKLGCWGRKHVDMFPLKKNPMQPIPKEHWAGYRLWIKPDGCASEPDDSQLYPWNNSFQDLHISKKQAESLWVESTIKIIRLP